MKNKDKLFMIMNIMLPLLIGALIYYLISPDVIFVRIMDQTMGFGMHLNSQSGVSCVARFMRNYLLDMLWSYSLTFALAQIMDNTAVYLKFFLISVGFSTTMEILQLTPLVKGTFDIWDILLEILTEVIAVIIIKKHNVRRFWL